MATLYKNGTDTSLYLVPGSSGGHLDVKSDFDWTLSRRASRDEVVPCYLWEYQPNNAQLINALYYWGYQIQQSDLYKDVARSVDQIQKGTTSQVGTMFRNMAEGLVPGAAKVFENMLVSTPTGTASTDPIDVYRYRYVARPTGFEYILPFLGDERFGVSNKFDADTLSNAFPEFSKLLTGQWGAALAGSNIKSSHSDELARGFQSLNVLKFFIEGMTDYKKNFIDTSSWSSTDPDSITIKFDLINSRSVEQANKNYEFCYLLNYQNHPAQRNAFLAQSPCIYTLFIPNTMYMPVCFMSNFTVVNVGANRMVDGKAMPEAFRISMSFNGILNPPSRNMLSVLNSGYNQGNISLPQSIIADDSKQRETVERLKNFVKDKIS